MVRFLYPKENTSVLLLIGINLGYWYAWALVAPVIVAVTRRFPLERGRWWRSLPVHLVAVFVVTVVHIGLFEWLRMNLSHLLWSGEPMKTTWWSQVTKTFLNNFDYEMMAYWAIAGAYSAVRYHGERFTSRTPRSTAFPGGKAGPCWSSPLRISPPGRCSAWPISH